MRTWLAFLVALLCTPAQAQDTSAHCIRDLACTPKPSCLFESTPTDCATQAPGSGESISTAGVVVTPLPGVSGGGMNTQSITSDKYGMELQNSLKNLQLPRY